MVRAKNKREPALFTGPAEENKMVEDKLVRNFRGNLEQTWLRLCTLIGSEGTAAIFSGVLHKVCREHLFLWCMSITSEGVRLDQLSETVAGLERSTVHAGFLAFSEDFIALLTDLAGDVLVQKIKPLLQEFE